MENAVRGRQRHKEQVAEAVDVSMFELARMLMIEMKYYGMTLLRAQDS